MNLTSTLTGNGWDVDEPVDGSPLIKRDGSGRPIGLVDPATGSTVSTGGGATLADALRRNAGLARNANPFDLGVMTTPPTVTVGAAAIANGQRFGYFDTDGHKRIRVRGVPFGDRALMCENVGGYFRGRNIGTSAGLPIFGNNAKHYLAEVMFSGQVLQWEVNGLNAALLRFRVGGRLVAEAATTAGATTVQIDFGSTIYDTVVGIEFEQAQTVRGVVVGPNDTVYSLDEPLLPLVLLGDSYVQGSMGSAATGGQSYPSALRDISGCNVLAQGIASSGYIKPGFVTMDNQTRLDFAVDAINASSAPVTLIPNGTNDYGLDADAVRASAARVGAELLARTKTRVVFYGPWPQIRNNDAGTLAIEAAIKAAADSLDQSRVGFVPVCSGSSPWVKGKGSASVAPDGGAIPYGNSVIVTGADNVHPAPPRGSAYLARKTLDSLIALCIEKGW